MRPDYLVRGEPARLFPVLATTSKEGRTTSILLACLARIDEFARELLKPVGVNVGKRSTVECWTEIVFRGEKDIPNDRPDGLIIVRQGKAEWRCLVESKVASAQLSASQIEKYRKIARDQNLDCVLTISNQFTSSAEHHPLDEIRKARSRIPVFHWSWMFVLTSADLLIKNGSVHDRNQHLLLEELRWFLADESAGVKGFDRMPAEWTELNRHVSAGGKIQSGSDMAQAVLAAWHQETKDLSLILSRQTEATVSERLSRKYSSDPALRLKDEARKLRDDCQLTASLDIPNAVAPLEIVADITRRTVDVGMTVSAPRDKQSSRARLNWLLRQIRGDVPDDLQVRCIWPGRSEATQFPFDVLREDPSTIGTGKNGLQVTSFHVFIARRLSGRFTQQQNFISDLEQVVPQFYREIGQHLVPWREKAPQIKQDRSEPDDVSVEAIEADAQLALEREQHNPAE